MNHDPQAAYRRELENIARMKARLRASYEADQHHRCARYTLEARLRHGDELMAYHRLPTQPVVDALNHIFALWRTT